jgi:hypothetical protein
VTIVRVGTTKKYSEGWESAFGKTKKKPEPPATKKAANKTAKKTAKASAKKKPAKAGKK